MCEQGKEQNSYRKDKEATLGRTYMNFQICSRYQEKAGVTKQKDSIIFSIQAARNSTCNLLLYPKNDNSVQRISMNSMGNCDTVYTVEIPGLDWKNYNYNFEINGEEIIDTYARRIVGREVWADETRRPREQKEEPFVPKREQKNISQELTQTDKTSIRKKQKAKKSVNKIKGSFYFSDFKWKDKEYQKIKKENMIIYKLHVRGFTMGMRGELNRHGTVETIERKLDYLRELGITTLLFMPVYEFEEILMLDESKEQEHPKDLINYWGYTKGNYFAPKASFLGKDHNPDNLKHLIQKMHEKQMECILEFYFPEKTNPHLIIDVFHYWHQEYHVDGFRFLGNPAIAELLAVDGKLSGCKLFFESFREELAQDNQRFGPELFSYNEEFLYGIRKVLNHQGGSIFEFACQMRRQQNHQGFVNFIAENNGFTLWDVFSYEHKHNEQNREGNRDGNDWNCSGNCGQEGISRKRYINELRKRQVKNALAVVFFAQGIPMIWMGDECVNSQGGNNNAYCQDNEIGWKDWKPTAMGKQITAYVKQLSKIRKAYPMLCSPSPYQFYDYANKGYPDLSYHSDGGWQIDFEMNRGFIGMFYSGAYSGLEENLYVAYNFQNVSQTFALPKGMEWKLLLDTSQEPAIFEKPKNLIDIKEILVDSQSICLLSGKKLLEGKSRKKGRKIKKESRDD